MVSILVSRSLGKFEDDKFMALLNELHPVEKKKVMRYYRWEDAQLTLLGKLLLMQGLRPLGFNLAEIELQRTKYNKPFIEMGPQFNISHSGEYVVCAISASPIGIDIEKIRPVKLEDFREQWHGNELMSLEKSQYPLEMFYRYWTRKESVIKADGRGLSLSFTHFDVSTGCVMLESARWFTHEIRIDTTYACHFAIEDSHPKVELNVISF